MRPGIRLSLYLCLGVIVVSCGNPPTEDEAQESSPQAIAPTTTISPSPTPSDIPTPLASQSPIPPAIPQIPVSPEPSPTPLKTPPSIGAISKSIYPSPTPVPIKPSPPPATNKAIEKYNKYDKYDPFAKLIAPANPSQRITPNGIGFAKIGMKFGELKQQLGSGFTFPVKTAFIPDFDAIAVTKGGVVQYYIPYPAGTNFNDDDRIQHLMTDNPSYRTEKGVGPGTPIIQAEGAYGSATLTFSRDNESGEFVRFTQNPQGLAFRPKPPKDNTFAGQYPESNDDYLKTQKYDTKAAIGQITVSCVEDRCGQQ
jgi:hypothetical protein